MIVLVSRKDRGEPLTLVALALLQAAVSFDLRTVKRASPQCANAVGGGEIVVCGRVGTKSYRLPSLASDRAGLPRAETTIGGVRAEVGTEQADVGGFASNRVMVRVKVPF